jgi:hypothetical protein
MHSRSRLRAGRQRSRLRRMRESVEQRRRHLRSPGVVHAREYDRSHRVKPRCARSMPVGQQRQR